MQEKKLYVGNLSFSITEDTLKNIFSTYGTVTDCKIIKDRDTGRSKGFGFIEFSTPEDAEKAISGLNGSSQDGRTIKVNISKPKESAQGNRTGFRKRY